MCLKEKNCQKTARNEEEKSHLSPKQYTVSQVDCNDGKTTCTSNCFRTHPILQIWLSTALKTMLQGKRFGSIEEMILEIEVSFEAKDKSFYKKGIELFRKSWNQCITLEGDYVDKVEFLPKSHCFVS